MLKVPEGWDYTPYLDTKQKLQLPNKAIQYFKILEQVLNK